MRRMTETRHAATEAQVSSGRVATLKLNFPELFDTGESATQKPNYFESDGKNQTLKPDYNFESDED